jgi:hypothetical protein
LTKRVNVRGVEKRAFGEARLALVIEEKVLCHLEPLESRAEGNGIDREGAIAEGDGGGWLGTKGKREDRADSDKLWFVVGAVASPVEAVGILGFFNRFRGIELEGVIVRSKPIELGCGGGTDEANEMPVEVLGGHLHWANRIHIVAKAGEDDRAEISVGGRERPGQDGRLALMDAQEL